MLTRIRARQRPCGSVPTHSPTGDHYIVPERYGPTSTILASDGTPWALSRNSM